MLHMICHNYRRAPAVMLAKQLIARGPARRDSALPRHLPAGLDHRSEVSAGLAARQGAGGLGRARRHRRARHRSRAVSRRRDRGGRRRPRNVHQASGRCPAIRSKNGRVTVDDAATALVRFENGAIGTIEATRMALGRKNHNRFEINGSRGSVAFDLERMNELEVYLESGPTGDARLPPDPGDRIRTIRTSRPGGRRATSSATSTRSRTPSSICSKRWPTIACRQPNFVDGVRNQRVHGRDREGARRTRRWVDRPTVARSLR